MKSKTIIILSLLVLFLKNCVTQDEAKVYVGDQGYTPIVLGILVDIKLGQYDRAERELIKYDDKSFTEEVIIAAYAHNATNFEKMVSFAKALRNNTIAEQVLSELLHQLKVNSHQSPSNMLELNTIIENKFIDGELRKYAEDELVKVCIQNFKIAVLEESFQNKEDILSLTTALVRFNETIFTDIFYGVIDSLYSKVSKSRLFQTILSNEHCAQSLEIMAYIYKKLKENDDLEDPAMFVIASYFYKMYKYKMQRYIIAERDSTIPVIENIINSFPSSLKTLCLENEFAFVNVEYSEYMIAGPKQNGFRDLLTSKDRDTSPASSWTAVSVSELFRDQFAFSTQSQEVLFASPPNIHQLIARTKPYNDFQDDKVIFQLKLKNNSIVFKNLARRTYLCSSSTSRNSEGKRIVLLMNGNPDMPRCQWQLEAIFHTGHNISAIKKNNSTLIFSGTLEAIKLGQYDEAEKELIKYDDKSFTEEVISAAYAHNASNFEEVVSFTKALRNNTIAEQVLSELLHQLKVNLHESPAKILELNTIIQNKTIDGELPKYAEDELVKICARNFEKAILEESFQNEEDILSLATALVRFNQTIFTEIVYGVIDSLYAEISKTRLFQNILSNEHCAQSLEILAYIYKKLKENDDQDDPAMFVIASYFYKLYINTKNGNKMTEKDDMISLINSTIGQFPSSLNTLYLAKKFSFVNVKSSEYMITKGEPINASLSLLITSQKRDTSPDNSWKAISANELFRDQFAFITPSQKALIVSSATDNSGNFYVKAKDFIIHKIQDLEEIFQLELKNNSIALKSLPTSTYLCAFSTENGEGTRFVMSMSGHPSMPACQWQLEAIV